MIRTPWHWESASLAAKFITGALTPVAVAYQAGHQLRCRFTKPYHATVPVICIGNATLGGVGKTPFAMLVAKLLSEADMKCVFLTRGYGGALSGPIIVDPGTHTHLDVGDEALLLAKHEVTIVARNRTDGAKLAAQHGADILIMDDGYQNPSLHKDISILLIEPAKTHTNQTLFPAGPFRETIADASARADLIVNIMNTPERRVKTADFTASLVITEQPTPSRIVAFAGIGQPSKFFDTLTQAGFEITKTVAFPDHHKFTTVDLRELKREAKQHGAQLMTTEKDFVRIPENFHGDVITLPVAMQVNDPEGLKVRLLSSLKESSVHKRPAP